MRTREILSLAKRLGTEAGKDAASWCYDGNTPDEWYRRTLQGISDGDPAVMDAFRVPDLSGEFAGDPTPQSLADDLGIEPEDPRADWLVGEAAETWMTAASDAFWHELERVCRFQVREAAEAHAAALARVNGGAKGGGPRPIAD